MEDFSVVVGYDEIKAKNYSLSAEQYFEVKIDYVDTSADEFAQKIAWFSSDLYNLFTESVKLEKEIKDRLTMLKFNLYLKIRWHWYEIDSCPFKY